ncbi:MAG: apolipoprotein N-acyltransferase [bacterium]|nr:apolipoprotein N-acyltransferase [bacterium]MDD5353575.1 apolipoprotein N-acyltransferase [bacterium]
MLRLLTKNSIMILSSALLLILVFPKYDFSYLAWICLIPLLISIEGENFGRSFLNGLIVGFIFYAATLYWVVGTLHIYGNFSWLMSVAIGALLMLYLALFIALFCGITSFFSRYFYSFNIFFIASLWVSLEYLRTYLFTGFPWNLLGYSQWNNLLVAQVSAVTGVYGVSFLIVLVNALAAKIISYSLELNHRKQSLRSLEVFALVLALVFGYGFIVLNRQPGPVKQKLIKTAVIQPNIPPDLKWNPQEKRNIMGQYVSYVERLKNNNLEVIVFPETAIPGLLKNDRFLLEKTAEMASSSKAYLLIGSVDMANPVEQRAYTSCFLVTPAGQLAGQYNKNHLVPFGEFVPFRKYLEKVFPVLKEMGDFVPGNRLDLMKTPHGHYGVNICYEDIFPDLVRRLVKNGAEVIVNITIDSWYLNTAAPYQHFYMNVFRAIENRRWVIRSASTGISGYIDPYGNIISQTKLFVPAISIFSVSPENKITLYTKYGDAFAKICVVMVILGGASGLIRRKAVA